MESFGQPPTPLTQPPRSLQQDWEGMDEVLIQISSAQMIGDQTEGMELRTDGRYQVLEDGRIHLLYMESELTGLEGTRTDIYISPDAMHVYNEVTVYRHGTINCQLSFRQGQQAHSFYDTPFGMVELQLHTQKLVIDIGSAAPADTWPLQPPLRGAFQVDYDMAQYKSLFSHNSFQLSFAPPRRVRL